MTLLVRLLRLAALAVLLSIVSVTAHSAGPSVTSVRIAETTSGVRLTLDLSEPVEPKTLVLPAPRPRLVIDLPRVTWAMAGGDASGEAEGLGFVRTVRFAHRDAVGSRLVLDLDRAGRVASVSRSATGDGLRLVFLIERTDASPTMRKAADVEPSSEPVAASPKRGQRKRIVIDAGHGGKDPGAISAGGLREKDVTLAVALRLRDLLESRGHVVSLTRDADVFLTLPERVRTAREARADLFISLHADSNPNPASRGATVYTLSEQGGRRALSIAEAHNWSLDLEAPPQSQKVESILNDLAQRETKNRSADFSQTVIRALEPHWPLLRNTHRNAGFFVLLAPDVPAVLIEMGFLTNAEDAAMLADPVARRRLAGLLADAVDAYFAPPPLVAEGR